MSEAFDSNTKEAEELSPPPPFVWRAWALRSQPVQGIAMLALFFMVAAGLIWGGSSIPILLFVILCMTVTLRRLLFPLWCEINTHGIEFGLLYWRKKRIPWREIAMWRIQNDELLLFPQRTTTPTDVFRILAIPMGGNQVEIESRIRFYLGPSEGGFGQNAAIEIIADQGE
jgi:hypothetical protein